MPHRRRLLAALLALVAGLLLFVGWCWVSRPRHRINEASFEHIWSGMTRAEVEAILGVPPGIYVPRELADAIDPINNWVAADSPELQTETWWSSEGGVIVTFRRDGTVNTAQFIPVCFESPTLLERIKSWLGW
jgi:hypothetical protein